VATVNFVLSLFATLTSLACMALLFRAHARTGVRLLMSSAMCFVFLSLSNLLLFLDLVVFPDLDLRPYRLGTALAGVAFLLQGFTQEAE